MTTDGGGWLVFQRRLDGSEDFYKNWTDYEGGFGEKTHEHWLGLLPLKRILSQGHYELRIDMIDFEGKSAYAKYESFDIGDMTEKYVLKVTRYSGTAGDSLSNQNGYMFSTKDKDNDISETLDCAEKSKGAWWYNNCHHSNLNGQYFGGTNTSIWGDGISWYTWRGHDYSMKATDMKIRRV